MANDDEPPQEAPFEVAPTRDHRASPPWVPSGAGVALDDQPHGTRQLLLTALFIVAVSSVGGIDAFAHTQHRTAAGFILPFVVSIAALAVIWAVDLGLRSLRLRRLRMRYPGTLVFSFRRSDDVSAALHDLELIDRQFEFNEFGIQAIADLHGITLWQGTPPQMYAALPWTLVLGTSLERAPYPSSGGKTATALVIRAGTADKVTRIFLFSVDASKLPFPSRNEIGWVDRQLHRLIDQAAAARLPES